MRSWGARVGNRLWSQRQPAGRGGEYGRPLSVAERDGRPIAVGIWLKAGLPVAVLGCALGTVVLAVGWNLLS